MCHLSILLFCLILNEKVNRLVLILILIESTAAETAAVVVASAVCFASTVGVIEVVVFCGDDVDVVGEGISTFVIQSDAFSNIKYPQ